MRDFDYSIPTKVYFGKGRLGELKRIAEFGKTVLLVYGGGSIKSSGLYAEICKILTDCTINIIELSGVEPNPRIQSVRKGITLCKEHKVDVVLAVGGGSVIDCSKVIASGSKYSGDPWDFTKDFSLIKDALPLVTILTHAATGSEMNGTAVISDMTINDKMPIRHELHRPKFSILDPEYTYSVPLYQLGAGICDTMCHAMENFFTSCDSAFIQDGICLTLIKACIKYGPIALKDPKNYEARANLMWASSLAINGLCSFGAADVWTAHFIEHELSAFYDIAHGAGLAIVMPQWMSYVLGDSTVEKFARYAREVFSVSPQKDLFEQAREGIEKTATFFASMGMPLKLSEVGIDQTHFAEMAELSMRIIGKNCYVPLTAEDVKKILISSL